MLQLLLSLPSPIQKGRPRTSPFRTQRAAMPPKLCDHGMQRSTCEDCRGGYICQHGKPRINCKGCGGGSVCEHGRRRSRCKDCGGSSICEHGRRRSQCKDCGGSAICEHGRQRYRCKDCGGSGICEHGKQRYVCKECKSRGFFLAIGQSKQAIGSSEVRGAFSQVVVAAAPSGGPGKIKSANQICRHVRNA